MVIPSHASCWELVAGAKNQSVNSNGLFAANDDAVNHKRKRRQQRTRGNVDKKVRVIRLLFVFAQGTFGTRATFRATLTQWIRPGGM